MRIILLSGGSGQRLWPLSNSTRSKQFLKLLRSPSGEPESMAQRVRRQIREAGIAAPITVATSAAQRDSVASQLGSNVDIVPEPERRDTFPAILLACAYLASEKLCPPDEAVVVLPIDAYTNERYFSALFEMEKAAASSGNLVLMGIKPSYPSEKYGYIIPAAASAPIPPRAVERFVEKPGEAFAARLIQDGALWNGGVFAFKLGFALGIARSLLGSADFETVRQRYSELAKGSFDREVVEKANNVSFLPFDGEWKDLGTWNTLCEAMPEAVVGSALTGEGSEGAHVINELDIPVVVLGVKNVVVAASPDGILVSGKDESKRLKGYAERLESRPMYEELAWGASKVIDQSGRPGERSVTRKLFVRAGCVAESRACGSAGVVWAVAGGAGELSLGGASRRMGPGDVASIPAGADHSIRAVSDLSLIELSFGWEGGIGRGGEAGAGRARVRRDSVPRQREDDRQGDRVGAGPGSQKSRVHSG
jgi:mannose-1-phosphate guanylyltransferase